MSSPLDSLTAGCNCWGCRVEIPRLLRALALATGELVPVRVGGGEVLLTAAHAAWLPLLARARQVVRGDETSLDPCECKRSGAWIYDPAVGPPTHCPKCGDPIDPGDETSAA